MLRVRFEDPERDDATPLSLLLSISRLNTFTVENAALQRAACDTHGHRSRARKR
jgi:hypothetical protein